MDKGITAASDEMPAASSPHQVLLESQGSVAGSHQRAGRAVEAQERGEKKMADLVLTYD